MLLETSEVSRLTFDALVLEPPKFETDHFELMFNRDQTVKFFRYGSVNIIINPLPILFKVSALVIFSVALF